MGGIRVPVLLLSLVVFVFSLSGCATTMNGQKLVENQNLKTQVADLQAQLQQKDEEIKSLRMALSQTTEDKYTAMRQTQLATPVPKNPSVKQIQSALKNAGYEHGPIDGRMGKTTVKAIRDFQKANNLSADGKVGKETWSILSRYLNKAEI